MRLGEKVHQEQIEATLLADPSIQDCVIRIRQNRSGDFQAVAYIVQRGRQQPFTQLQQYLKSLLERDEINVECDFVSLTCIPHTAGGEIDETALESIPVIDDELALNLADRLHACGEIDQAAVVIDSYVTPNPPLHLSELLPDWMSGETGSDVSNNVSVTGGSAQNPSIRAGIEAASYGGELAMSDDTPRLLSDAIEKAAAQYPDNGLVYVQGDGHEISQTYSGLLEDARHIASALKDHGLIPGERVIFQMEAGQDFIPAFWGCVLGGFVPVPVAVSHQYSMNDGAVQKLIMAWQMLHRPVVLASSRIRPELESLAGQSDFDGLSVYSIDDLRRHDAGADTSSAIHHGQADDPVVILLTSGSTGLPKGVVLSHANLLAMALGTAQQNGFTCNDVTLNWMPLEHVGAVSFLQTMAVVLGCRQVHAPTEYVLQNPLIWLDLIEKYRASITWGPNFTFGLLNDLAETIAKRSWDLSSMHFMVSAAEQIVAKSVRQFLRMLAPHGLGSDSIHPAFGMSETCSGITWSDRFSLETTSDDIRYVELGAPIPSASLRIVDADDRVLAEGEIGRLQLMGPSVTAGYYENSGRNRAAFTEDGWFDTGDLGFLYEGRLTLTGREKEEIIINGINYSGAEIEAVVDEIDGVMNSFTAACGVQVAGDETDKLAIFFVPVSSDDDQIVQLLSQVRQQVAEKTGISPTYLLPLEAEEIPKTDIGKIQRSRLRERFKHHKYDAVIRRVDVLTENANTIPDWFYKKRWLRRDIARRATTKKPRTVLMMLDQNGTGRFISDNLREAGHRCICVEASRGYSCTGQDSFVINPDNKDDYLRLLNELNNSGAKIGQVVHCWTHTPYTGPADCTDIDRALQLGCHSLMLLVQSLMQAQGRDNRVGLFFVSNNSQHLEHSDEIAYEKTPVLGLLKTIPRELPWLECQHIDLGDEPTGDQAGHVLDELESGAAESSRLDNEVAYRQGKRLICRLQHAELVTEEAVMPLKSGGIYLVTGGLGGIGRKVAEYLLETMAVKLLLVGRSKLTDEATDECAKTVKILQSMQGEVIYVAVDIGDTEKLKNAVEQAELKWQARLDGIIHLAGAFHECTLEEETPARFDGVVKSKMQNMLILHQLLHQRGGGLFIGFGSLSSFFGATKLSAYAAANSFLTGFQQWQQEKTTVESYCFDWSMWEDLGMSRGFADRDAFQAAGYCILKAEQAINAFVGGLYHGHRHLMIGLNDANANVAPYLDVSCEPRFRLTAYLHTENARRLRSEPDDMPVVTDPFGNPVSCRIIERTELPLTADGKVDRDALVAQDSLTAESKAAPQTEQEKRIASIWQDVLGINTVGIHDNFFALGGDSLKGARIMNRLQEETGVTMHVVALFNAPTVAELALHLVENYTDTDSSITQAAEQQVDESQVMRMRSMIEPLHPRSVAAGSKNRRAVFVLSPPRSGSTLLRVMLGGNPGLFAPPELYLMPFETLQQWHSTYSQQQSFWREGVIRALMEIQQVDAQQAEQALQTLIFNGLSIHDFYQHIQQCLGQRILVDKTPTYALDLNVLKRIEEDFEDVLYIHLLRHPYGVIRSFEEARLDQLLYAFMPSLQGKDETVFTRRQLAELTWLICHQNIVEYLQQVPAQRKMQLKFESLVTQPRASMEQVSSFLGVEFHADMLQPYEDKAVRMTDGVHEESRMLGDMKFHTHKGIDEGVADRWRQAFNTDFLGDASWQLAESFGYERIRNVEEDDRADSESVASNEEELLAKINDLSDEDVERELEKMLAQSEKGG